MSVRASRPARAPAPERIVRHGRLVAGALAVLLLGACWPEPRPMAAAHHHASHAMETMDAMDASHEMPAPPMAAAPPHAPADTPHQSTDRLAAAIRAARPGDTIDVAPDTYTGSELIIDKPLVLRGHGSATLDGEGAHQILTITGDDVTVAGLRLAHVGTSYTEDRSAIRVSSAHRCTIEDNRIDDAFFGIYLAKAVGCQVRGNVIHGRARTETASGNGIHLWGADSVVVAGNDVEGHRDGIYLEFSRHTVVRENLSRHNLRYGLHFMYSDDCTYRHNTFRANGAGVAVMYARRVSMTDNRFEDNRGSAAYGLLLKEIFDSRVAGNRFVRNTTGLLIDGANRLAAEDNRFVQNGWALRLDGGTQGARFTGNDFIGNTFDVGTTGRALSTTVNGNYWDRYHGYDLDRDGIGDVPYHPVSLFSMVVARNAPALILLRGAFVSLLEVGERALPALTPPAFADSAPRMRVLP